MTRAEACRAGRREWIGLSVLAVPCLLISMDASVLDLAVPHLSAALEPSSTQLLWIIDVYGFLLASSLITMGRLGDRIAVVVDHARGRTQRDAGAPSDVVQACAKRFLSQRNRTPPPVS